MALKRWVKSALIILLLCLLPSTTYAAAAFDDNYITNESYVWKNVPTQSFSKSQVSGTYALVTDTDNGCVYIALFLNDAAASAKANISDARISVKIESPSFTEKRLTFANHAVQSTETIAGLQTKCNIDFQKISNAGVPAIGGTAYIGIHFEQLAERVPCRMTVNYSCGDSAENIFKRQTFDLTPPKTTRAAADSKVTNHSVITTKSSKAAASADTTQKAKATTSAQTKYTGKAPLATTASGKNPNAAGNGSAATKYQASVEEELLLEQPTFAEESGTAGSIVTTGKTHLSTTSIVLLCIASVLAAIGMLALIIGCCVRTKRKKEIEPGEEQREQDQS